MRQWSLVGCLPSMGSHRVRHDWSDLAAAAAAEACYCCNRSPFSFHVWEIQLVSPKYSTLHAIWSESNPLKFFFYFGQTMESHWRRKWQPTPVFLPGKSNGQRRLMDCSPWCHKALDTTERLTHTQEAIIKRTKYCILNLDQSWWLLHSFLSVEMCSLNEVFKKRKKNDNCSGQMRLTI